MSDFTPDEIKRLRRLLDVDDIKKLGLLYSQLQDHAYLDQLADIFTEDALCEFGPYGTWNGRKEIRENYAKVKEANGGSSFSALHANSHHWVEMTGPDTAVGRRYLLDLMTTKPKDQSPFIWLGLYDEEYRKVDGQWLISRTTLQFLWPEKHITGDFPGEFPPKK